jgi:mannose/fructose/N-acetylgalactosamine-specific phosphotransferase system component IIC
LTLDRFIAYGVTVWWGTQTTFWQSQCDEMVGGGLIQGVSVTFVSLSFLFTLLLIIPVFFPT